MIRCLVLALLVARDGRHVGAVRGIGTTCVGSSFGLLILLGIRARSFRGLRLIPCLLSRLAPTIWSAVEPGANSSGFRVAPRSSWYSARCFSLSSSWLGISIGFLPICSARVAVLAGLSDRLSLRSVHRTTSGSLLPVRPLRPAFFARACANHGVSSLCACVHSGCSLRGVVGSCDGQIRSWAHRVLAGAYLAEDILIHELRNVTRSGYHLQWS